MSVPLVKLKQVSKCLGDRRVGMGDRVSQCLGLVYPPAIVHAVDGVDPVIRPDEVVDLAGESGCGKPTLSCIAAGLIPPSAGEVRVDDETINMFTTDETRAVRLRIQMIFQNPYTSLSPCLHVEEIIGEAARVHDLTDRANFIDCVTAQMQRAGLDPTLHGRYPRQFSGSQYQRIDITHALAVQSSMLVCGGAVVALDISIQAQILNLSVDLREQLNLTYLFISHDLGVVEHLSDRVVIMYLGRVAESVSAEEVLRRPNHPYMQTLLAEIPYLSARHKTFIAIQNETPSSLHPLTGCHFHLRCPHATPRCKIETPTLHGIVISHINACHPDDVT